MKYLLTIIIFNLLFINNIYTQCTNCTTQYPAATQTTSSSTFTNISTCMYGSDYAFCDVIAGKTYEWTTCGDTDFNTQLTLYVGNKCTNSPAGSLLAYNDDAGGACTNCTSGAACGLQSRIIWTATFTGTVRILVSKYNCTSQSTCMTLQWRCVDCTSGSGQPNQYCSTAVNICNPGTFTGSTNGALNQSTIDPSISIWGCNAVYDNFVWYTFTTDAVGSPVVINLTPSCQSTSQLQVAIFDAPPYACQNGTYWATAKYCQQGTSAFTINASGLLPNTLYYMLMDQWPSGYCDFTFAISGNSNCYTCPTTPLNTANQDCINAIPICQNEYCQENSYTGAGANVNEINPSLSCLSSGERNDVWYTFTVQQSGNLSFLIYPRQSTDDYDWAVYNLTNANCSQIATNSALQVSCNYSSTPGTTGPNGGSTNTSQGAGGTPYNAKIPVTAGQTYVINVSNFSSTQFGYGIDFTGSTAVIFDNIPPQISNITSTTSCGTSALTFRFTEPVLCNTVAACDFTVTGPGGPYTVTSVSGAACTAGGTQESQFTINITPALSTAGSYNLNLVPSTCSSVTDLCGNVAPAGSLPFTIVGPTITMSKTNVNCFGGTNGTATATVTGGSPNYTYTWTGGTPLTTTTSSTTNAVTGLAAGTYTVTVSSNGGCQSINTVTVTQPLQMTVALSPTHQTCSTLNNGSILVNVTNGTANYSYACTGQTTATNKPNSWTFSGLAPGSYTITVTDASGCTTIATTTINPGPVVTAGFTYPGNQCRNLAGNPFTFTNTGSSGAGVTYSWTFPGGTPAIDTVQNPTVSWNTTGGITVTQTVTQGGCSVSQNITVTIYPLPNVSVAPTNVSCNGFSDGSALATATGGSGIYNYTWSNSAPNNATASGLVAGTYTVTVTDSYGCNGNGSVTITQPAALSLIATRTNASCFDLCNGTANVTVTGGSGSYTYLWSNAANTSSISGLCDGTYIVSVYDANSTPTCYQSASVVVTEPAAITLTPSFTNSTCGGANGTASVVVNNGAPNYTYNWVWTTGNNNTTTPTNTSTVNALPAGPTNVTVTDGSGCSVSTTINISDNLGTSSSITSSSNVTCNGGSNGSATVTVVGGTPNYTYVWDSGTPVTTSSTTNFINTLNAGVHTVVITDAMGCVTSASVTITQPVALSSSTSVIHANCGQSNGSVTVNVSGGTGSYTYAWSGGGALSSISSKPAGTYTVTVTDINTCFTTVTATINNLSGITSLSTTQTSVSCNGGNNGTANVTPTGGTPPYSYSWNTIPVQNISNATGLSAQAYTVIVTDNVGCSLTTSVTITQPSAITSLITAFTNVSCNGGNNGSATVTASAGTPSYTYQWSAGAGSQVTQTAINLSAGIYSVTVTDVNNCLTTSSVTITQPTALIVNISSTTNAHCGNSDGIATVTQSGGTSSYTYQWGTIPVQNTASATGLSALGSPYSVTVTDSKGCQKITTATISDIPAGTALISSFTNPSCNGSTNGSATVSISGATSPYAYQWSTVPVQTTTTATGLSAGTYTVTVRDFYNCNVTTSVTITQPALLNNSFTTVDATCYGYTDGSISANPTGGTSPYSFQWNNIISSTTQGINNLAVGCYKVTITDFKGCIKIDSVCISQPSAMTMTATITSSNCNQKDGAINITVANGPTPFTYLWNNSNITEDLDSIQAGIYCVTVTNVKGCSIDSCFNIPNLIGPTSTISSFTNSSCFNQNNGSATVNAVGGSGFYTYLWSDPDTNTTATAVNLPAGIFTVTVTDTTGCYVTSSVTITQPILLSFNLFKQNPKCNAGCDGWARVVPVGGTPPYTFQWFGGGSNPNDSLNTGLCAANYDILITDSKGCDTLYTVTISQPTNIVLSTTNTQSTCSGISNASATVNALGGTGQYTYQWGVNAGSQTTQTASGLSAGIKCVTVTDSNSCTQSTCVTVTTPNPIVITVDLVNDLKCFMSCDGSILTTITGGTPPYSILWNNGKVTDDISNLCAGDYVISITDANSCTAQRTIVVSQPPQLSVTLTPTNEQCYQYCNGSIYADVSGGTPISGSNPYQYLWDDANLLITQTVNNLCPGSYNLTVTDANSCKIYATSVINGPSLLQLIIANVQDATCDSANACATIDAVGGTYGFSIAWGIGGNTFTKCGLSAGAYDVSVTDINGCLTDTVVNINNIGGPVIDSISRINVDCFGQATGWAVVNYSGGTPPINIQWGPNANNQVGSLANNLIAGNYSVTLTDANSCKAAGTVNISGPASALNSTISSVTNATCYGVCNASATVLTVGGTAPYTYMWNSGPTTNTASQLCAGTYSVQSTDSKGCTKTSYVTITQPAQLLINVVEQTDITCFGRTDGKIIVSTSGGSNTGYSYQWLPSISTNSTAAQLGQGDYTVIVADNADLNCTTNQTYTINEPTQIVVQMGYISPTCGANNANGAVFVTNVSGGTAPYAYNWSPCAFSCSNDTIYNINAGNYQVQVFDANACDVVTNTNVNFIPPPALHQVFKTNVSCNGLIDGSAVITVKNGIAPYFFMWIPNIGVGAAINDTTYQLSYLSAGYYNVSIADANNCIVTTTFQIVSPPALQLVTNGPANTICIGSPVAISASIQGGVPPYTFVWDNNLPAIQSHIVSPTTSTVYNVQVTDANGCFTPQKPIYVYVYPVITSSLLASDTVICKGDSVLLTASHAGGSGNPYSYNWSHLSVNSQISSIVVPTTSTTYSVTVTDFCGSPTTPSIVNINVLPLPQAQILGDILSGCEPVLVKFSNPLHSNGYTYNWNFGDLTSPSTSFSTQINPSHNYLNSGNYSIFLTVTSIDGCRKTFIATNYINVYPNPDAAFIPVPQVVEAFKPEVQFFDQSTQQIENWYWNFGDGGYSIVQDPTHRYEYPDSFIVSLKVITDRGCVDSITNWVKVKDAHTFYAPTAFSPSSGGLNPEWYPQGIGIDFDNYHLYIYDRWGELIFDTDVFYDKDKNPNAAGKWNGRVRNKGKVVELGVYVWYVVLKDVNGVSHEYSGNITVLR